MTLLHKQMDLFLCTGYPLAHCISADYALGAGIARDFERRFHLRKVLEAVGSHTYPDCIKTGNVFNLVTKERYWHKPTEQSLSAALYLMKAQMLESEITKIAMPEIGCGLDRLSWPRVRQILYSIFEDTEVELLVCYL